MPSFYQHQRPHQFGYPASDFEGSTMPPTYSAYHDHAQAYGAHHSSDLRTHPYDMYKNSSLYGAVGYGHRNSYSGSANGRQQAAVPTGGSMRINDFGQHHHAHHFKSMQAAEHIAYQNQHQQHQHQSSEDDKPVGGVSAKLDYNMDEMTDFVVEMVIAIISPSSYNVDTYRKWVVQVLNATRLPSATILLSLSYMTMRVRSLTAARYFHPSEYSLYEYLTVALILGSKFLDDNTFQNKSWAEVSNIKVGVLNKEELNWLSSFGHRLHHDPHRQDGFATWEHRWSSYKAKNASKALSATLHTPDSGVDRQFSRLSPTAGPLYHPQYPVSAMSSINLDTEAAAQGSHFASTNSPYENWYSTHSNIDRSPSTAPHTGPNTPEFYAGHGGWHPYDNLTGRARPYGYGGNAHMNHNFETYPPAYEHHGMNYGGNNVWNCHGAACQCSSCRQTHMPRYGPIVVG